jgi:hypothetical protein
MDTANKVLEETKIILEITARTAMERGVKIEDLERKSSDLEVFDPSTGSIP